jgi:hypothetical protein
MTGARPLDVARALDAATKEREAQILRLILLIDELIIESNGEVSLCRDDEAFIERVRGSLP